MGDDGLIREIEFEGGNWDYPVVISKGSILEWNSSSIEVIEILSIELGHYYFVAKLLVKFV